MGDQINRNPHPDFKKVEASRPDWEAGQGFHYTKTADPDWTFGQGRNSLPDAGAGRPHVAIDPHAEGRPAAFNYKMLISAITPRPIAFVSTRSADGGVTNLAPFSYFNVVTHDPPVFMVGFSSSVAAAKDTLKNLLDSRECVINIISETYLEAANSTSVDALNPDHNNYASIIGFDIASFTVCAILCSLRFYVRIKERKLKWDDWFLLAGVVSWDASLEV